MKVTFNKKVARIIIVIIVGLFFARIIYKLWKPVLLIGGIIVLLAFVIKFFIFPFKKANQLFDQATASSEDVKTVDTLPKDMEPDDKMNVF